MFLLVAAMAVMAQAQPAPKSQAAPAQTVIKCRNQDGRACTSKQVEALSDAVFAAKRQHDSLAQFKDLTLISPDGTLQCSQNGGAACTASQLDAVKQIATGQQLYINYKSSQSGK